MQKKQLDTIITQFEARYPDHRMGDSFNVEDFGDFMDHIDDCHQNPCKLVKLTHHKPKQESAIAEKSVETYSGFKNCFLVDQHQILLITDMKVIVFDDQLTELKQIRLTSIHKDIRQITCCQPVCTLSDKTSYLFGFAMKNVSD